MLMLIMMISVVVVVVVLVMWKLLTVHSKVTLVGSVCWLG